MRREREERMGLTLACDLGSVLGRVTADAVACGSCRICFVGKRRQFCGCKSCRQSKGCSITQAGERASSVFVGREQCEKGARTLNWARLKGDYVNVDSSDDRVYQWPIFNKYRHPHSCHTTDSRKALSNPSSVCYCPIMVCLGILANGCRSSCGAPTSGRLGKWTTRREVR